MPTESAPCKVPKDLLACTLDRIKNRANKFSESQELFSHLNEFHYDLPNLKFDFEAFFMTNKVILNELKFYLRSHPKIRSIDLKSTSNPNQFQLALDIDIGSFQIIGKSTTECDSWYIPCGDADFNALHSKYMHYTFTFKHVLTLFQYFSRKGLCDSVRRRDKEDQYYWNPLRPLQQ